LPLYIGLNRKRDYESPRLSQMSIFSSNGNMVTESYDRFNRLQNKNAPNEVRF
jgi:hypothetical protein